jgi:hypothetical protein
VCMFSREAFIMSARGGLPCETGTVVFAGCEETRCRGRHRVFSFSGGCLRIAPHVRPSLLKSNVVGTLQSKCCHQSGYLQRVRGMLPLFAARATRRSNVVTAACVGTLKFTSVDGDPDCDTAVRALVLS